MPNGDDEQNLTVQGTVLPDDDHLRNRMRLQGALREELATDVKWLMQSEQDLLKIFRFYILVLGAFISIASILPNEGQSIASLLNVYTLSAVVFWAIAVLGAIVAYVVIWSSVGVGDIHHVDEELPLTISFEDKADAFSKLELERKLGRVPDVFEDELIYSYIQSIHHTEQEFGYARYPFLWGGMALVSIAVLLFGIGLVVGNVETSPPRTLLSPPTDVINASGIGVFLLGCFMSAYLVQQVCVLRGRIWGKIVRSAAFDPCRDDERARSEVEGPFEGSSKVRYPSTVERLLEGRRD